MSYKTGIFPLSDDVFGIYLMFCAQFHLTLWPWRSTFLTLEVSDELRAWNIQHIPILASYGYLSWVTCDSIWSHYHHLERSLRMRRVTWSITGGNDPHFWNLWPQFTYSICHYQGATAKIKLCEGYKVHCACAVSRGLCIGVPPKPQVTIFWPQIVYSLYNLYGASGYDND